ncbi:sigma factor [Consotaella salsifontis]|uniref:DNA-directed RNA polymerase specialized sigma subunit, sigma24 family n=1 Tax=Consotaella salsifontis TaxID=1365950 RepID=A0A1T4RWK1_9HYPH|nr:sigma factor [Consotaella salsifontis]SKA20118.1 DNA-directed RNA polymerase specialized sigma subunit, sigma24 family [Consotaella salsifontis]
MISANDNIPSDRPAEFDNRLVAYLPGLRRLAKRIAPHNADDLVNDTVALVCERWVNFRGSPTDIGFWAWLSVTMRGIASNQRRRKSITTISMDDAIATVVSINPAQEAAADLSIIAGRSSGVPGDMLMASAMGDHYAEIADRHGTAPTRVRYVIKQERRRLIGMAS